jgi:hypothetical protein
MRLRRRRREAPAEEAAPRGEGALARIRNDLASLGVSAAFSDPVATRIAALCPELEASTYAAVLDGVAVAYDAHRTHCDDLVHRSRDIDEIQHLMQGFAGELRKLEEGLRIVSAYVLRMHSKARGERGRTLH